MFLPPFPGQRHASHHPYSLQYSSSRTSHGPGAVAPPGAVQKVAVEVALVRTSVLRPWYFSSKLIWLKAAISLRASWVDIHRYSHAQMRVLECSRPRLQKSTNHSVKEHGSVKERRCPKRINLIMFVFP